MKNWKTTASGIVAALPQILAIFGVALPPDAINGINALGLLLIGFFSKDWNVTGGTKVQ